MHANEGRPFFVIVTGKVYIEVEDDHLGGEPEVTIDNVFEKLARGIVAGGARRVFEDDTGGVYEIPRGLVSVASKSYLLVGYGRDSIPVILVVQDLLFPFRRPGVVLGEVERAIRLLKELVMQALPEEYRSRIGLRIVDARAVDAPFSLDQIEFVPER